MRPHLKRRLILEAPERVSDGAGGYSVQWVALGTLWSEVKARTGREIAQAGAPISAMRYKITVRGAPIGALERPKPEQRFREGERLFVIEAVAEDDAYGRYLSCFVTEETAV